VVPPDRCAACVEKSDVAIISIGSEETRGASRRIGSAAGTTGSTVGPRNSAARRESVRVGRKSFGARSKISRCIDKEIYAGAAKCGVGISDGDARPESSAARRGNFDASGKKSEFGASRTRVGGKEWLQIAKQSHPPVRRRLVSGSDRLPQLLLRAGAIPGAKLIERSVRWNPGSRSRQTSRPGSDPESRATPEARDP